jgi:hypothetical protein
MILRRVDGDAVKPGIEGTLTTKARQRPERLDERFLGHIFHVLWIPQVSPDQIQDLVLVPGEQQIERAAIPLLDASDKFFVRIFSQYQSLWRVEGPIF